AKSGAARETRAGAERGCLKQLCATTILKNAVSAVKDDDAHLLPFEVQQRHFPLIVDKSTANPEDIRWLSERWQVTHKLILNSAEFSLAVEAIDSGQFIRQPALALVSLWSSLEALFSPSTAELKFRVSALIAAFLGKVRTSP
ncbi:hypothetical protein ACW5W6_21740, partial [Aeromonas mytilicola]